MAVGEYQAALAVNGAPDLRAPLRNTEWKLLTLRR